VHRHDHLKNIPSLEMPASDCSLRDVIVVASRLSEDASSRPAWFALESSEDERSGS
jgi:hypothetical protein